MHLLSQVRGQRAHGHEVSVGWLKGAGSLAPDFRAAGAEAETLGRGPALARDALRRMRAADLVHSHLLKADGLAALLAPLAGRRARLVAGKHNDERALLHPAVSLAHRVLGRVPRVTIVLSDHVGRYFEEHGGVPRARQRRIYYGIDPAPFEAAVRAARAGERERTRVELGFGAEDLVLACVARFAPQKAHDVLLRAFSAARSELAAEGARARLLLVGDDPFGDGRERAERLAGELALGEDVRFAGIRRDVPRLLAASDVFVMSSLWEGLGLVFLEAMACGLPVLGTRVSAVPEVVVEGETGLLVAPADERDLARGILELARDRGRREALGAAGRERLRERFGLERMVRETLAVYGEVTGLEPFPQEGRVGEEATHVEPTRP